MMTKIYDSLCQMLEKEVCNIEQNKVITKESLELLKCLTETLNNLKELKKKEEEPNKDLEMSSYNPYYDMSGAQRRDSMGRYMDYNPMHSMNMGGMSNARNSRDYNYSRDDSRKKMVRKLETLMDDTMSENERQAIQDCITKIEQ